MVVSARATVDGIVEEEYNDSLQEIATDKNNQSTSPATSIATLLATPGLSLHYLSPTTQCLFKLKSS
eukprot:7079022-Ditylum_brightwellii.AAC.1